MDDSENNKLIVRNVHALLPSVSKQIEITNKLLAKIDNITEEDMIITVSHQGYIKRNPLSAYRSQRRGGKDLMGTETKEEDFVEQFFMGLTHDSMLFFSNLGRLYWLKIYQIPEAGRITKGKALVNLLQISEGERIATALPVRDFKEGFLVMFTKSGRVKRTSIEGYSNPNKLYIEEKTWRKEQSGENIIAITLDEGDELIAVKKTDGKSDLIIGTKNGLSIRFNEDDVRDTGRTSKGVIGMRLEKGDEVIFADVAKEKTAILTVTENGIGKRIRIQDYPLQGRGHEGVISIKLFEKSGRVAGLLQVQAAFFEDEDEVFVVTNNRKLIRMKASNIGIHGRNTHGVRLMDLDPGDRVVSIGRVVEKD